MTQTRPTSPFIFCGMLYKEEGRKHGRRTLKRVWIWKHGIRIIALSCSVLSCLWNIFVVPSYWYASNQTIQHANLSMEQTSYLFCRCSQFLCMFNESNTVRGVETCVICNRPHPKFSLHFVILMIASFSPSPKWWLHKQMHCLRASVQRVVLLPSTSLLCLTGCVNLFKCCTKTFTSAVYMTTNFNI
jgi:hypothetical protein